MGNSESGTENSRKACNKLEASESGTENSRKACNKLEASESWTEKSRKACNKLIAIDSEIDEIVNKLIYIKGLYDEIMEADSKHCAIRNRVNLFVNDFPEHIAFNSLGIVFYIDFTIINSGPASADIAGSIVYGVCKKVPSLDSSPENGDGYDELKYKPLTQLVVDQHGMIQSDGKISDEWWIKDEEKERKREYHIKQLGDLHYRTLEAIWKEALDWINEDIVP